MSDQSHPIDRIRTGLMAAIGGEPAGETLSLIEQQLQVADRELEQVPKRAEERGSDFVEAAKAPLQGMLDALSSYKEWLLNSKAALEEGEATAVVAPYEASTDVLPALQKAVEAYSTFYTSYGPHQTAVANNLRHTGEGIRTEKMPKDSWPQYIDYYVGGLVKKIQTVRSVELPGRTFLAELYVDVKDQLMGLREADVTDADALNTSLETLDLGLVKAEQLETTMSESAEGPSPMPPTNVLVALMKKFKAGEYSQEFAETALDDYSELMDAFSETFENAAGDPIDSALVQEEIPRTLEALDAHYSGVESLISAVEDGEAGKIDGALEKILSTSIKIGESREVYMTAAQHMNNTLCPACGRSNPPENRICEACGETLPRVEDPASLPSSTFSVMSSTTLEESQQMPMTENIAVLFDACDNVADGHISMDEFLNIVGQCRAGLTEFGNDLEDIAEQAMDPETFTEEQMEFWKTQHLPYLEEIGAAVAHGIKTTEEGLRSMESFAANKDEQVLVEGVRMVWEGMSDIHRATLSLQTHSSMLDEFLDEVQQDQAIFNT